MLYLGAEVATSGEISSSTLLRARRVIRHYKKLIEHRKVDEVICVATSAIRSAKNGDDVVQALSKTLGYKIRVISGEEEAKLIFRGISALSTLPESRILATDMGGGSLELMAGQRHGLEDAKSVPLGASRIARELKVSDPLRVEDIKAIEEKCDSLFEDFKNEFSSELFSHIVVSSGTLTTLVNMARAKADGRVPPRLTSNIATRKEIMAIADDLIKLDTDDRQALIGYDFTRNEFLPTAAVIAKKIMSLASKQATWMASAYALREGIALSIADEHSADSMPSSKSETADATINFLVEKMQLLTSESPIISHSKHISVLSSQLFDSTKSLHKLKKSEKEVLKHASLVHDIGETISHSKHDQHGTYILSSIPLAGFTPEEATLLKGIVRWHRNKDPKASDKLVGTLDEAQLQKAQWLTAIFRVADGADSSKRQLVKSISASVKPDTIFIKLESNDDIELEIYSARRKRVLLENISGRDVVIQQVPLGQGQQVRA